MVINADWQIEYRDLLVDGNVYRLKEGASGFADMPDLRTSDRPRLRRHGTLTGDDYLNGRTLIFDIQIVAEASAFNDAVRAVCDAFSPTELASDLQPLTFLTPGVAASGTRRVLGRVRRRSAPIQLTWDAGLPTRVAMISVQFDCPDPRIYDNQPSQASTGLEISVPGLAWNLTWNLNWGGVTTGNIITAENNGAIATPVQFRIDGPVTNPIIENITTGQVLSLTADSGLVLDVGDFVIVDSDTRTVLLGGTASRYSKLSAASSWFDLPPGTTAMRFTGTTTGSPTLTATFRSAWI